MVTLDDMRNFEVSAPQLYWEINGVAGALEIESIRWSGGSIDSEDDWSSVTLPTAGALEIVGLLCGTEPADAAYGWVPLSDWNTLQDPRSLSLYMSQPDGTLIGMLDAYEVGVVSLDPCVNGWRTLEVEAQAIEQVSL